MSFFKTVGAVAVGLSLSASSVSAEQRVECRSKKKAGRRSNLALIADSFRHSKKAVKDGLAATPKGSKHIGAGYDLTTLEPFKKHLKDGYSHVACLNEGLRKYANLHEDPNAYAAENLKVSVVFYDTLVAEEDREPMTHDVCFNYCRTLDNMNFFGLFNGRECYCAPYFKAEAGGEDQICDMPCDGNTATMCGGTDKSDMFEMHMCADTSEELGEAIDRGRELMMRLYEPTENLGSSASVLQYIGSMTQVYSGQAGDTLAGSQAQEVKGVAGENFALVRESVKAYLKLKTVITKMEEMVVKDFTKAANAKAADSTLREFGTVAIEISDEIDRVRGARDQLAGYRGHDHKEHLPSYKEFATYYLGYKQELNRTEGSFKSNLTEAEVDSVCDGKKLLRTLQGSLSDCAYQCDRTLHPQKCVAFQHYDLVGYHTDEEDARPNFVMCHWWGVDDGTEGGFIKENGDCDFITMKTGRSDDGSMEQHGATVTGAQEYDKAYGDFIVEGPVDLVFDVKAGDESCFVTWWSDKDDMNYVYKPCPGESEDDKIEVQLGEQFKRMTVAELKEFKIHFEEGSHLLESNYYGSYGNGPLTFIATKRVGKTTGVCGLYADLNSVSYYTCPTEDRVEHSNPGGNAQCMVKVSEGKGMLEAFKKTKGGKVTKNERCMIKKEQKIPEYHSFDFVAEVSKLAKK